MKKIATILAMMAIIFVSCSKDNMDVKNNKNESIVTGGVYDITYTSAKLYGYFNMPVEMMGAVNFGIVYSTSSNPTKSNGTIKYASDLNSESRFDVSVSGLAPGTTYYYCAVIKYATGNFQYGKARSFNTSYLKASINVNTSNVGYDCATISGKLTTESKDDLPSVMHIYFSADVSSFDDLISEGITKYFFLEEDGSFNIKLNSLYPDKIYDYVLTAIIRDAEVTSEIQRFSTKSLPELMDLGLSVKWRSWNLGANYPEQYGGYYQWAGTKDVTSKLIDAYWYDCPYCIYSEKTGEKWSKYCPSSYSSLWAGTGNPDNKTILDSDDDVAHVKLGGKWRMPTKSEFEELINNCWCDFVTYEGVKGMKFTSKKTGYTDNWIFLPAAGERYRNKLQKVDVVGYYWSSSLSGPSAGRMLAFDAVGNVSVSPEFRPGGLPVRPVSK